MMLYSESGPIYAFQVQIIKSVTSVFTFYTVVEVIVKHKHFSVVGIEPTTYDAEGRIISSAPIGVQNKKVMYDKYSSDIYRVT